jgi:hypothetical protein
LESCEWQAAEGGGREALLTPCIYSREKNAWERMEGLAGGAGKLRQRDGEVGKVEGKLGIRTRVLENRGWRSALPAAARSPVPASLWTFLIPPSRLRASLFPG